MTTSGFTPATATWGKRKKCGRLCFPLSALKSEPSDHVLILDFNVSTSLSDSLTQGLPSPPLSVLFTRLRRVLIEGMAPVRAMRHGREVERHCPACVVLSEISFFLVGRFAAYSPRRSAHFSTAACLQRARCLAAPFASMIFLLTRLRALRQLSPCQTTFTSSWNQWALHPSL